MRILVGSLLICAFIPLHAEEPAFLPGVHENIVIFGDSITVDGRYGQIIQDFVDKIFPERQIRVMSHGKSGDTVRGSLARVEADIVAWRPDWVLINLGVNDTRTFRLQEYLFNYEALINRIYRDTRAKIGIISPIFPDNDRNDPHYPAYMKALPELAAKYGCLYIPCCETFQKIKPSLPAGVKYAPDGIHPNPLGYWIFAESILKALHFPFDGKPIPLTLPVTRVTAAGATATEKLAGQSFSVALPDPLEIKIDDYHPPAMTAKRLEKPPKIDGKLTGWDLSAPVALNSREQQSGGTISWTRDHFGSTAYACYDDSAFYFAVVVKTAVVLNSGTVPGVSHDCVELFLDARTPEERATAKTPDYHQQKPAHVCQLILSPATAANATASVSMGAGNKDMIEGVVCASSLTNTGYILECKIPADRFPPHALAPGAAFGIDFSVNDVDRFETWNDLVQLRWSGSQMSFFSVLEFGRVTLTE